MPESAHWPGEAVQQRAPDQPQAPVVVRVRARQRRSRVSAPSDRVEEARYRHLSVHRPSPGSVANGGGVRLQPDPPSNNSGGGGEVNPPAASSPLRGNTTRAESVSSGTAAANVPPSVSSALSSIGGEPLAGSGFETQPVQRGFAPAAVNANPAATAPGQMLSSLSTVRLEAGGDSVGSGPIGAGAPSDPAVQGGSGVISDVTSVGNVSSANPQPPNTTKGKSAATRTADQMKGLRRRLRSLPSDAAPHATPPRIPIEHEE